MRILVTGSRNWTDAGMIYNVLLQLTEYNPKYMLQPPENHTLVSGACSTGADMIAERIAKHLGMEIERHPADWKQHDKAAGFIRNAEMVKLGADVCIAFIKNNSRGATHASGLAQKAGIETKVYQAWKI